MPTMVPVEPVKNKKLISPGAWAFLVIVGGTCGLVIIAANAPRMADFGPCEIAVRVELRAPSTAVFYSESQASTGAQRGSVDSQNGFGGMTRSDWICTPSSYDAHVDSLVQVG